MDKNITILVNSCDLYEEAWHPFFKLMEINWPESKNYKIVLHTETKIFNCDFFDVRTICTGTELAWTERLKIALNNIDTEYVLFFLEDFFLYDKVDNALFDKIKDSFINDDKIGTLWFPNYFSLLPNKNNSHYYNDMFVELSKHYISRVNLSHALWRKKYFLKMLYTNGTPWYFENCARTMSILLNHTGKAVTVKNEFSSVFPVDNNLYGITKRKWLPKNIELFEKYKIEVNFEHLGIENECNTFEELQNKEVTIKRGRIKRVVWLLKRNFKFVKRAIHIAPSLYKYCKKIDNEYKGK